jgi:hypothetical protein
MFKKVHDKVWKIKLDTHCKKKKKSWSVEIVEGAAKRVDSSRPALGFAMRCSPSRLWRICEIVEDECPSLSTLTIPLL